MSTLPNESLRAHLPSRILLLLQSVKYFTLGLDNALDIIIYPDATIGRYLNNILIGQSSIVKSYAQIVGCNRGARVIIGSRTTLGYYTFIYSHESIQIGDDCMIAPFVYITDNNHGIDSGSNMNTQAIVSKPICIGNDVWVGAHSVILPGIRIGNGAVVGANSVVTTDVGPGMVVAGNPAKVIRRRS